MTTLEDLLDAADALSKQQHEYPPRPDFAIPEDLLAANTTDLIERKSTDGKGIGWFARRKISAGTVLMASKPLAMVMDHQDDGDADDEEMETDEEGAAPAQSKLNWLIVLELLKELSKRPELWSTALNQLFPRNQTDLDRLPPLQCQDEKLSEQIAAHLDLLKEQVALKPIVPELAQRLPLIVRYNVLSVETCPELLSHPTGHAVLGGVGLYLEPSFFNHSARPNVARWAVGDVMCFVTNQDISAGTEACISYIEHDVLCESDYRRNLLLQMDFYDGDAATSSPEERDGPETPVVDGDVQNELMEENPLERLESIDALMLQAEGKAPPDEEVGGDDDEDIMEATPVEWYQCDKQNLRILKAITLDSLAQSSRAIKVWEECVQFSESQLPPLDESSVVMRVQAALCSWQMGEKMMALEHAQKALETHSKIFGGGTQRFRRRYQRDFDLSLRINKFPGMIDSLWPISSEKDNDELER